MSQGQLINGLVGIEGATVMTLLLRTTGFIVVAAVLGGSAEGQAQQDNYDKELAIATKLGQREVMSLGVVELRLGMSQDKVIAQLAEHYELVKQLFPNSSMWSVFSKHRGESVTIGTVFFNRRQLSGVSRSWTPDDQRGAAQFASAVYGAISQLVSEGKVVCRIAVESLQGAEAENKTAYLICGGKRLEIGVSRTKFAELGQVDEVIGSIRVGK